MSGLINRINNEINTRQGYTVNPNNTPQPQSSIFTTIATVVRMIILYWFLSTVVNYFRGKTTTNNNSGVVQYDNNGNAIQTTQNVALYSPQWTDNTPFSMYVYIAEHQSLGTLNNAHTLYSQNLVYSANDLVYNWDATNNRDLNITLTDDTFNHANYISLLQRNQSLYAHTYVINNAAIQKSNNNINVNELVRLNKQIDSNNILCTVHQLNTYRPAPKIKQKKNLFASDSDTETIDVDDSQKQLTVNVETTNNAIINYWKPTLSIRYLHDFTQYRPQDITQDWGHLIQLDQHTMTYKPVFYVDEFWLLSTHYMPINHTVDSLPLQISISPISLMKFRLQLQMDLSWKVQQSYGQTEHDTDQIKRIFVESNPYFLALTMAVSLLHSLFDFLAFKNDIAFWKSNTAGVGLSRGSIVVNTVCQLIIFLYLFDNETSYIILVSQFVSLVIECWKITKSCDVTRTATFPYISIKIKNLGDESVEAESTEQQQLRDTAKYDAEAMSILSKVLFPLVVLYSIYTLVYEQHKSFYSWLLSSLVGAVYCFGFILMCPQLYLNYKLKSVAHMPWRQMSYKFLNTIIDDLFAFVISMPILHRISVFRDDLIFCMFLYQRWIYRVDYTRTNEFGLSLTEEERLKLELEQAAKTKQQKKVEETQDKITPEAIKANDENTLRQRKNVSTSSPAVDSVD